MERQGLTALPFIFADSEFHYVHKTSIITRNCCLNTACPLIFKAIILPAQYDIGNTRWYVLISEINSFLQTGVLNQRTFIVTNPGGNRFKFLNHCAFRIGSVKTVSYATLGAHRSEILVQEDRLWVNLWSIAYRGQRNNDRTGVCQVTRYARNLTYGLSQMAGILVGQVFPLVEKNRLPFIAFARS
jgi:hypothetical protein